MSHGPVNNKCESCGGKGFNVALVCSRGKNGRGCERWEVQCRSCGGKGFLTPQEKVAIDRGREMKEARLKEGKSLREKAREIGVSMERLSKMELGIE